MVDMGGKAKLLEDIGNYIARVSQADPIPFDFLNDLHTVEAWAKTANSDELPEIEQWVISMGIRQ